MSALVTKKFWVKQLILWAVVFVAFLALFIPVPVKSQSIPVNAQPAVIDPCSDAGLGGCVNGINTFDTAGSGGIVSFILTIARLLTFISGALAVLFIVYAGFTMVTSNGDKNRYETGLKTVQYAVVGLVVAIVAYTIVTLVGNILQGDLLTPGTPATTPAPRAAPRG